MKAAAWFSDARQVLVGLALRHNARDQLIDSGPKLERCGLHPTKRVAVQGRVGMDGRVKVLRKVNQLLLGHEPNDS